MHTNIIYIEKKMLGLDNIYGGLFKKYILEKVIS